MTLKDASDKKKLIAMMKCASALKTETKTVVQSYPQKKNVSLIVQR